MTVRASRDAFRLMTVAGRAHVRSEDDPGRVRTPRGSLFVCLWANCPGEHDRRRRRRMILIMERGSIVRAKEIRSIGNPNVCSE